MITLSTFFGFLVTSYIIAYLISYSLIGIFSLFKNVR